MKLIEFRRSTIKYAEKEIIKDFSFEIEENKHVSIIGRGASGKTSFLKALTDVSVITDLYLLERMLIRQQKPIREIIAVVLNDMYFLGDKLYNELAFSLRNRGASEEEVEEKVNEILDEFNLREFSDHDISLLSDEQKILARILSFLIYEPKVIAIDDLFIYLTNAVKAKLMKYIKKRKITLLLVTSDIEDTLLTDYIYVFENKKIIEEGEIKNIYNQEKLLNDIGYGLPFIVELSSGLKAYGLTDKIHLNKRKLVSAIWK